MGEVLSFHDTLSERELECMNLATSKSHEPTLLCVINGSHSVRKHFCELELQGDDVVRCLFLVDS